MPTCACVLVFFFFYILTLPPPEGTGVLSTLTSATSRDFKVRLDIQIFTFSSGLLFYPHSEETPNVYIYIRISLFLPLPGLKWCHLHVTFTVLHVSNMQWPLSVCMPLNQRLPLSLSACLCFQKTTITKVGISVAAVLSCSVSMCFHAAEAMSAFFGSFFYFLFCKYTPT